jgi:hypothetical protein
VCGSAAAATGIQAVATRARVPLNVVEGLVSETTARDKKPQHV